MPADIRSFFGGGSAPASQASQEKTLAKKKADTAKPKARKSRAVVEESDEDEVPVKKTTPKKAPAKKQKAPSPEGKATTTSDYFDSSNKPKRSEPVRSKVVFEPKPKQTPEKASKAKAGKKTPSANSTPARATRGSTNGTTKHYDEDDFDDLDNDDDIFSADVKKPSGKAKDEYEEEAESEPEEPVVKRATRTKGRQAKIKDEDGFEPEEDIDMKDVNPEADFLEPDEDEVIVVDKPVKKATKAKTPAKKRKSDAMDDESEEDETPKKATKAKKSTTTKAPAKKKAKKEDSPDNAEILAIHASIPTINAPEPPPKNADGKYSFNHLAQHSGAPPAGAGSKEIPIGAENCLAGLSFVFTGQNETLGRDEGIALVKRYGGKMQSAPSKKTSYVVLGTEAGPKKLQVIKENGLAVINEDGFFELLRKMPANGGDSKAAEKNADKKREEEKKIKEAAAEMEKQDRDRLEKKKADEYAAAKRAGIAPPARAEKAKGPSVEDRLWTVKYAPTQLTQICGNKAQVEKLQSWLRAFPNNLRKGFKLAGKDGSGTFRAVIISGPPGIGKTTAAHLVAKLEGYDIVEMNASDTRSKKLMEEGLRGVLGTTSLLGYFAGDGKEVEASKRKLCLIMDEVDGMSAGDRGGVGALAAVCKKTSVPMILICNDRKLPKMRPFDYVTYELAFRRPTVDQVRGRIMTIAFREGMKMPAPVIDALIEGSNKDIRQVVNMLSSAKLDEEALDFDRGKDMSKAWEKHIVLKPWDITSKILGGGMFNAANKSTLNDKIELYFNDHEFSYLMLQENYIGTQPAAMNTVPPKDRKLKALELVSKAADSISDGDLVDRMIHGSQQQWSLMPTHAIFSFVRPASFVAGNMAGNQTRFTSWLGKNSAQGKFTRMIKEIQGHMRLRASADRHEVRQQYIPVLWRRLVDRLQKDGKDAVPEIIELMDSYFLTREDWDAIMELGVDSMDMDKIKIESASKATFTRLYNAQSHPLPFIKASAVAAPKAAKKDKPDLEEAIDESEDEALAIPEDEQAAKEADEEKDLAKDKYIKAPKKRKAAAAGASKAKGKGKKRAADDDDDEDGASEDEKPVAKKGRGGGAAGRGRGRGKK